MAHKPMGNMEMNVIKQQARASNVVIVSGPPLIIETRIPNSKKEFNSMRLFFYPPGSLRRVFMFPASFAVNQVLS